MKLGFVGTGAIATAVTAGLLADAPSDLSVTLSPRNAARAAALARRFPQHVTIAPSNQAVLDAADVVMVAVVPGVVREVMADLRFRPDHLVVSLVATVGAETIRGLVAPATRVVRAIPLPSAAERASPTPVMPPDPVAKAIFDRTGIAIETADARAFDALAAASGVMASHFALADMLARWLGQHGLDRAQADAYVRALLLGLAGTMHGSAGSFADLAAEHMTKGGLNEQLLAHVRNSGAEAGLRAGLDDLFDRIVAGTKVG